MTIPLVPILIVRGDPARPVHVHTCVSEDKNGQPVGHQYECDSPYCERLVTRCTKHGGSPAPTR